MEDNREAGSCRMQADVFKWIREYRDITKVTKVEVDEML